MYMANVYKYCRQNFVSGSGTGAYAKVSSYKQPSMMRSLYEQALESAIDFAFMWSKDVWIGAEPAFQKTQICVNVTECWRIGG